MTADQRTFFVATRRPLGVFLQQHLLLLSLGTCFRWLYGSGTEESRHISHLQPGCKTLYLSKTPIRHEDDRYGRAPAVKGIVYFIGQIVSHACS